MLNADVLKNQIKDAIHVTVIPAISEITKISFPEQGKKGDELAEKMANTFDELVSEQLAEIIANAIDAYIKNMAITGTIITIGSPTTQTAQIFSTPSPMTNGKVPNTLGVS